MVYAYNLYVTGDLKMVKLLRSHEAELLMIDNAGCSPLHYAIDGGNSDLVKWLLLDGCEVIKILQ